MSITCYTIGLQLLIYAPTSIGKRHYEMMTGVCLSVCLLSVCSVPRPNSRTERPRKPKIGRWKHVIRVTYREPI